MCSRKFIEPQSHVLLIHPLIKKKLLQTKFVLDGVAIPRFTASKQVFSQSDITFAIIQDSNASRLYLDRVSF